jgi:hypothetical protein
MSLYSDALIMLSRFCLLALAAYLPVAHAADSLVRSWVSPDHKVTLNSTKLGGEDELEYRLTLVRRGYEPVVVDEYLRDVDVLWSPDSRYVAVTDWIGSNVADCYVIDTVRPEKKISVTEKLPKLAENVGNSHFYVSCQRWVGSKTIVVEASGHTDYAPSHEFAYHFTLDLVTGAVTRP